MEISVQGISKRFGKNWIFKDKNFTFSEGDRVAITGSNGSGKSTLLQILSGYLTPTRGAVFLNEKPINEEDPKIGFVGPYMEIIEELTLHEFLTFHSTFKTARITFEEMAEKASLPLDRPISEFSTGMKQRTKLISIFYFENDLIFMDEPTSNLDSEGSEWWLKEVSELENKCILFVASNQKWEIDACNKLINLKD